jgi:phosphoglucosamine mutase
MSNLGLDKAVQSAGGTILKTQVGDRYVMEKMLDGGFNLGGEQSGHVIFHDHTTTGDGVLTALQVLAVMVREGKPLSEIAQVMQPFPQVLVNLKVKEKIPLENLQRTRAMIQEVESMLQDRGRVLVRYSGTEPKARIMIEGENQDQIQSLAEKIKEVMQEETGS